MKYYVVLTGEPWKSLGILVVFDKKTLCPGLYLFILCVEALSMSLHKAKMNGSFHGMKVARDAPICFSLDV